jgi:type I restriction enzyme, S subunit
VSLQMPHGWCSPTINQLCLPVEKIRKDSTNSNEHFTYYDIDSINNATQKVTNPKTVQWKNAPSRAQQIVQKYDIIFSTVRTYLKNIAIVEDAKGPQIASTGFCVLRSSAAILPRLLFYYTLSKQFLNKLSKKQRGTSYPAVRNSDVLGELCALPPLPEQHRIVAKIEELFSDLDAGVEPLHKAKDQLKTYRQSVLKWAFEGKLTEEWRKRNKPEPASELLKRIRAEREKKHKEECEKAKKEGTRAPRKLEELAPIKVEELVKLPVLPKGWNWARLATITEIKGGITKDGKKEKGGRKEVPYLRVANVQRGFIDLTEVKSIHATPEEIADLRLRKNDILFNEGGDRDKLGRGWIWNEELPLCIHQNHVFRARVVFEKIESRLISYFGNTFGQKYFLDEGKQTTNLASINLTKLSNFPVPLAPHSEQEQLLQEIESRLSVADNLEKSIDASLAQADALRQSILKFAFEGKLVPQDPNDEPAEKLVERIENVRTADIRGLSDGADFKRKTKKKQNG